MTHVNIPAIAQRAHPLVQISDGQAITVSTEVARVFEKRHDHVLDAIKNLLSELPADHAPNFREMVINVEIGSGATRKSPAYHLTRDGFTLLAMGFTGKRALAFKLAYIDAFNKMEAALTQPAQKPLAPINVQALLFDGLSPSPIPMPLLVHESIDAKAWEMTREANKLIREHLIRYVAHHALVGHPTKEIDVGTALVALEQTNLGSALAHVWREKINGLRNYANLVASMSQQFAQRIDAINA